VAFSKYENDDVAHSEAMDTLLRLVRRSEAAFWELVDEKGMAAELVPAKTIEKIAMPTPTIGVAHTNVLSMADFRAAAPSSSPKTSYTYPVDNSGAKKWK
jgi:HTH-type transcriptional regulator/antitoxin MqsA